MRNAWKRALRPRVTLGDILYSKMLLATSSMLRCTSASSVSAQTISDRRVQVPPQGR
jgi:hypothetical protein